MTVTNKRLLKFESHDDSNRCTPYRGKPDQYVTRFSRSVRVWSKTICISRGPHIAIFRTVVNRFEWVHCPREEGLPTQSTTRRLTDPQVRIQLLSHNSQWNSEEKSSFCWHLTTRLTGPISPACDRYVQYLLTGANPSVFNWHRRGLQSWRCRLATYHSPTFSTICLHFPLMTPSDLQFNQVPSTKPKCWVWEPMAAMWSFNHSTIYRSLHLRLDIANDISLVIGVTRIDRKVTVMQLGTNKLLWLNAHPRIIIKI
jgi:hypothetical protein